MAEQDVVRVRRLEIVDDRGRVRIVVGLLGHGEEAVYGLRVDDPAGRAGADLAVEGPTTQLSLWHDGNERAAVTVDAWGEGHLRPTE